MNPRAATNDLLPFQGSPFNHLGTSAIWLNRIPFGIRIFNSCTGNQSFSAPHLCTGNGESGIRTHAPLRTNGFQDRLVMTTSISLQSALSNVLLHSIRCFDFCQAFFRTFFIFLKYPKNCRNESPPIGIRSAIYPFLLRSKASAITMSSGVVTLMFS